MNRRDYYVVIDALADARRQYPSDSDAHIAARQAIDCVADQLCHHLSLDNANFNRDKFLAAFTARI